MQKDDFPNKIVIKQSKENPNELILPRIASNSDEPELKIVDGGGDTKKVFEIEKTNKFKDNPLIKGAGDDLSQKNTISGNGNGYKFYDYHTGIRPYGFRSYLYYATVDSGAHLQWAQPHCYKLDGYEMKLSEILETHTSDNANCWTGT